MGLGCDIIEVQRIKKSIERYGARFLDRIFTPLEKEYCLKYREPAPHFAARFAAKEALVKALGTGISETIGWLDIEVSNDRVGKPHVKLSPRAQDAFGNPQFQLSLSHCKEYAMAVVVLKS